MTDIPSASTAGGASASGPDTGSPATGQNVGGLGRDQADPGLPAPGGTAREDRLVLASNRRFVLFQAAPSWLVSMVLHVVLLLLAAFISAGGQVERIHNQLVAITEGEIEVEEVDFNDLSAMDVESFQSAPPAQFAPALLQEPEVSDVMDLQSAELALELSDFSAQVAPQNDLLAEVTSLSESALEGRSGEARSAMVQKYGGTAASERSVALALQWLARHQLADGGWSFNHAVGECQGRCSHPGSIGDARNAATAMALLPFLGAGQTHLEGAYKKNVEAGLVYLVRNMQVRNGMGSLWEDGGRMYSHGLCAITLCEAYAMTQDPALLSPAQLSLNYIVYAQDPVGGGWRYEPREPGDTSVVGWQLMALKSGHLGHLQVPPATIVGVNKFLDHIQKEEGAKYKYTYDKAGGDATTAVGLLCRMYLGWKHDHPALQRGVAYLGKKGPAANNMYYNYYATQVLRHYGGEEWEAWNELMREHLIKTQTSDGHAMGSWHIRNDSHSEKGGRLYCTSMATMILEVYYRHMPIYGEQAAEDEFPL